MFSVLPFEAKHVAYYTADVRPVIHTPDSAWSVWSKDKCFLNIIDMGSYVTVPLHLLLHIGS
jgi:hypothetical protein